MSQKYRLFRKSLSMILTLSLLLLSAGCVRQTVDADVSPLEVQEDSPAKVSSNTISSAEYTYSPAIKFLDDDALLHSMGTQSFELDCPISSEQTDSQETVFVKLKLPEGWTQDSKNPALFFFPDGTKAMQIEILPMKENECIWSAERLWEDESCVTYSEKYIHYSWNTFPRYTFYSVHSLDQPGRYDYTYYLPYGSFYFAVHFDTAGENNETALRFQEILLETIQLLTPIPSDPPVLLSGETWKATVFLTTEEQTTELTLDVPVEWAQEKPGSSSFYDSDHVAQISGMDLIPLQPGETAWNAVEQSELFLQRTTVINGQEIPRLVFTPPYKPGEDRSEEFGVRRYYYYLPMEENCLVVSFFAKGIDNEQYIRLHQSILKNILDNAGLSSSEPSTSVTVGPVSLLFPKNGSGLWLTGEVVAEGNQLLQKNENNTSQLAELLSVDPITDSTHPFEKYDLQYADAVNRKEHLFGQYPGKSYHIQKEITDGGVGGYDNTIIYCIQMEDQMVVFSFYPKRGIGGISSQTGGFEEILNTIQLT